MFCFWPSQTRGVLVRLHCWLTMLLFTPLLVSCRKVTQTVQLPAGGGGQFRTYAAQLEADDGQWVRATKATPTHGTAPWIKLTPAMWSHSRWHGLSIPGATWAGSRTHCCGQYDVRCCVLAEHLVRTRPQQARRPSELNIFTCQLHRGWGQGPSPGVGTKGKRLGSTITAGFRGNPRITQFIFFW